MFFRSRHEWLASRVLSFMDDYERARRLEAVAQGVSIRGEPLDVMAGLMLGITRAYCWMADGDTRFAPRVLLHLGQTHPELAPLREHLVQNIGSQSIKVWSDLSESAVITAESAHDPMPTLLEFAGVVRLLGEDRRGDCVSSGLAAAQMRPPRHLRDGSKPHHP